VNIMNAMHETDATYAAQRTQRTNSTEQRKTKDRIYPVALLVSAVFVVC